MIMQSNLSEQELVRRDKLKQIEALGINPYPAPTFEVTHSAQSIKAGYTEETAADFQNLSLAGRIMMVRDMGKANFAVLQDATGRMQISLKRDDLCPGEDKTVYNTL